MNSFEKLYIERLPITQNLLRTVRLPGEFKGKQELFTRQIPQVLETLRQAAMIDMIRKILNQLKAEGKSNRTGEGHDF